MNNSVVWHRGALPGGTDSLNPTFVSFLLGGLFNANIRLFQLRDEQRSLTRGLSNTLVNCSSFLGRSADGFNGTK